MEITNRDNTGGKRYTSVCQLEPENEIEQISEWKNKDAKAKADIVLTMSPSELNIIRCLSTSGEVWLKIKSTYESKELARKATLLKRITLSRMKDCDNLRVHIAGFFDAVAKLKEIDLIINDDVLAFASIQSFENFRCTMETRDELPNPELLPVKIAEEHES